MDYMLALLLCCLNPPKLCCIISRWSWMCVIHAVDSCGPGQLLFSFAPSRRDRTITVVVVPHKGAQRQMDRNQAWPGETSSQLASTSTHELFGSTSASSSAAGAGAGGHEYQQQHQYQQQLYPAYQTPHPYQHEHQYASEMGAKKAARRNRNALSCAECRRLKLKCSRVWPCTVSGAHCDSPFERVA